MSWLNPDISDSIMTLQNYILYRCDRTGRQDGEFGFYLQTSLDAVVMEQSMENALYQKHEFLIVEINNKNLFKLSLYIDPQIMDICKNCNHFRTAEISVFNYYKRL